MKKLILILMLFSVVSLGRMRKRLSLSFVMRRHVPEMQ